MISKEIGTTFDVDIFLRKYFNTYSLLYSIKH